MEPPFVETTRELPGRHTVPLYEMQLCVRTNGVHAAWFHEAHLSGAGSDRDIEDVHQRARMLRKLLFGYVVSLDNGDDTVLAGFLRDSQERMPFVNKDQIPAPAFPSDISDKVDRLGKNHPEYPNLAVGVAVPAVS